MAGRDKPIEKVYYAIGEVAEMMHENASTLRFWESEFEWIKPKRKNTKKDRRYSKKVIKDLMAIRILIKVGGMTLDGVRSAHELDYLEELKEFFLKANEKTITVSFFIDDKIKYNRTYRDDDPKQFEEINQWWGISSRHHTEYQPK